MMVSRLELVSSCLCKINRPTILLSRGLKKTRILKASAKKDDEDDKPIQFSKSAASSWKAKHSRLPKYPFAPHTDIVVGLSIGIFLLYFCFLREENDLDEMIYRPLPEVIEGVEKMFPEVDFYSKPDYIKYHEDKKLEKQATATRTLMR